MRNKVALSDENAAGTVPLDSGSYRLVLDAIPDGITVHATDGQVLYANRRLARIYGKTESEMIGANCSEIFHTDASLCPHELVLSSKQGIRLDKNIEIGDRTFSVTLNPIMDESGGARGYVRVMRDITERQRAQEQLLKAERFATLGQMISGIAHDVGTPLNIISGYSEYLLMRTKPEGQGYKELSTILQQTRRIAEFIKQMLDLARPAQLRADPIGLKGFLAESLDLMGHHLRRADIKGVFICKVNPPLIYADAPRLRQALFNLWLNACQSLPPGSKLEIVLDEDGLTDAIRLSLIGTDAGGRGHDFSRSLEGLLQESNSKEVVGMGLSLAKDVFDNLGARIESADLSEQGVALVVFLPKNNIVGREKARP